MFQGVWSGRRQQLPAPLSPKRDHLWPLHIFFIIINICGAFHQRYISRVLRTIPLNSLFYIHIYRDLLCQIDILKCFPPHVVSEHTHKICTKTCPPAITHLWALRNPNSPKGNWRFLAHSSQSKNPFCFRNETGQSSQPLAQKWIMCLLSELGPIAPFYISWLCVFAVFFSSRKL